VVADSTSVLAASDELTGDNAVTLAPEPEPWSLGIDAAPLRDDLGLDPILAEGAVRAASEAAFQAVVESATVEWQGLALLALATGSTVEDVRREFHLDGEVDESGTEDERLVRALRTDAAKTSFHWIEDNEELRTIVEAGDFGAWRVFLHPEQRNYVERDWKGSFRLSGGAGTGKTVVAVHRTRRLALAEPSSRILLTTYTRNLADDLEAQLRRLDDTVPIASHLGQAGVLVRGIDALARTVIQKAGPDIGSAAAAVVGSGSASILKGARPGMWEEAIRDTGRDLPPELANESFLAAEYAMVVLPAKITTLTGYLRVRRAGRGVALDRVRRTAVWSVIEAYRSLARMGDSTDFEEKAAIATEWLRERRAGGEEAMFDRVVVDEAQDLTPSRLSLLRALADEGPNDLFICEDSHQRIWRYDGVTDKPLSRLGMTGGSVRILDLDPSRRTIYAKDYADPRTILEVGMDQHGTWHGRKLTLSPASGRGQVDIAAVANGALWVVTEQPDELLIIDPASLRIRERLPLTGVDHTSNNQVNLTSTEGTVWLRIKDKVLELTHPR
jgi:hypothetical protein